MSAIMMRGILFLFLFSSLAMSQGEQEVPCSARSVEFNLTAKALDENTAIGVIEIAEGALDYFYRVMGRTPEMEVRCDYIWHEGKEKSVPNIFTSLLQEGNGFEIHGFGNLQDERTRETLIRSCMIVFLQSVIANKQKFKDGDVIPHPPMWLAEGLTQGMMEDRHEKFERVIFRAAQLQKIPDLKTIQQWQELSSQKLERIWQQAFCYWLLNRTMSHETEKQKLCVWAQGQMLAADHLNYWNTKDEAWWEQAQLPTDRSPMMTWEATSEQLKTILAEKDENQIISKLMELQLRAHFLFQPALELYIQAYSDQGEARASKFKAAQERQSQDEKDLQYARSRMDEITMNYNIGKKEEFSIDDKKLLKEYDYLPIDDIFKRRLDLFETRTCVNP